MSGLQGPLPLSSPMAAGSYVPAPAAWFRLLRQFPDLDPAAAVFEPVRLTVARAAHLIKFNKEVHTALRYPTDAPEGRCAIGCIKRDCEHFAIRNPPSLLCATPSPRAPPPPPPSP